MSVRELVAAGRPRAVIAVPATGSWFRENWDIAHELGHLTMGHHDDGLNPGDASQHEAAANAFAAELLRTRRPRQPFQAEPAAAGAIVTALCESAGLAGWEHRR
jgi:hypothetical protein